MKRKPMCGGHLLEHEWSILTRTASRDLESSWSFSATTTSRHKVKDKPAPWQPTHPAGHGGREATPLRRGAAPCCVQSYRAKDEGGAMLTYHPDGERAIVFSVAMALFAVILRRSSHDHSKVRA